MVLLSFDIEEFDMPFEYGKTISFEDQISISRTGTTIILDLLQKHNITATFFCTATFAKNIPDLIQRIVDEKHELASHSYYHSQFEPKHLKESKELLEEMSGLRVSGYRMPRMMPVDEQEIANAGYVYNTSINPTYLPGRYNNFHMPRTWFWEKGVLQIPTSVTPIVRIPLFWLSLHNFSLAVYKRLCSWTYKTDRYLNLYYHPWEFTDLKDNERFGFPGYVSKNSGEAMTKRLDSLINYFKAKKYPFGTFESFIRTINRSRKN